MKKIYDLSEWYDIVSPIINHPEYQRRKTFRHHGDITVYEHMVNVSIYMFIWAKKLNLNVREASIAGILHDFYTTPWQDVKIKQPFFKMHGFTHAAVALENSKKYFNDYLDPVIENSILRHMFPLNRKPPKYKIGFLLTLVDKYVSMEMLREPESIIKTAEAIVNH